MGGEIGLGPRQKITATAAITLGAVLLVVLFSSILVWGTALGGIPGMMLAIPLTAFAVVFWRLLKKKYIREVL